MLFKFAKTEPIYARSAVRDGDIVETSKGNRKIKKGQWYVVDGDEKFILEDKEFRAKYHGIDAESKLHLENPDRVIAGSI